MAENQRGHTLTRHVRERYVQRTNKRYSHLQSCRNAACQQCQLLKKEIRGEVIYEQDRIDAEILARLDTAEENRSYQNNTGFMQWYYEKYGFEKRFEFLIDGDLLFVVIHDAGRRVVVTCVSSKTHIAGRAVKNKPKFNRVKKKEEKLQDVAET